MKAKFRCPKCGFTEEIEIAEKTCLAFHKCKNCAETITPKGNSCCITCSYHGKNVY